MELFAENKDRAELAIATLAQRRQQRAEWLTRFKELITAITPTPPSWEDLVSFLTQTPDLGDLAQYNSIPHLVETIAQNQERAAKERMLSLYLEKTETVFPLAPGQRLVDVMTHPPEVGEAYEILLLVAKVEAPARYLVNSKADYSFAPPPITPAEKDGIFAREKRYIPSQTTRNAIAMAEGLAEIMTLRAAKQGRQVTPANVPEPFELTVTPFFEREYDRENKGETHPGGTRNPFLWRANYEYFFADNPDRHFLALDEKDLPGPTLPSSGDLLAAKQKKTVEMTRIRHQVLQGKRPAPKADQNGPQNQSFDIPR